MGTGNRKRILRLKIFYGWNSDENDVQLEKRLLIDGKIGIRTTVNYIFDIFS